MALLLHERFTDVTPGELSIFFEVFDKIKESTLIFDVAWQLMFTMKGSSVRLSLITYWRVTSALWRQGNQSIAIPSKNAITDLQSGSKCVFSEVKFMTGKYRKLENWTH